MGSYSDSLFWTYSTRATCLVLVIFGFANSSNTSNRTIFNTSKGLSTERELVKLTPDHHILLPDSPEILTLSRNACLTFFSGGISAKAQFVLMQVHSQHISLTLTCLTGCPGNSISGNSVGIVTVLNRTGPANLVWNLTVTDGTVMDEDEVMTLVVLQQYEEYAPIPGGCNQVFSLELDPSILLTSHNYMTQVWFQWASVGGTRGSSLLDCESKYLTSRLKYDVYVQFVPENDGSTKSLFEVLRSVSSVSGMKRASQLVLSISNDGTRKSLVMVTSRSKQGAVYGVVVRDEVLGTEASYVLASTYSCNYTAGQCALGYSGIEWTMFALCGTIGVFLLLIGHSWFIAEITLFGFIASSLVGFTLLSINQSLSDEVSLGVSFTVGLLGAVVWYFVWKVLAFPSISVMLPGLSAGYLLAAVFFLTPFANISWWGSAMNYGLIFTCITLLFTVCLLCKPRFLNIISCGMVGGYLTVVAAGICLRSSLLLVVLNVVYHAKVPDYASATVIAPFQLNDIILACLWFILLVSGVCWQYYRNWGKAHFPGQTNVQSRQQDSAHIRDGTLPSATSQSLNEQTPLLFHQQQTPTFQDSINS